MLLVYSFFEKLILILYFVSSFPCSDEKVLHLNPEQEKDKTHFVDSAVSFGIICLSFSCNGVACGAQRGCLVRVLFLLVLSSHTFTDKVCVCVFFQTGVELELQEKMPFLEWMANNYKSFGMFLGSVLASRLIERGKISSLHLRSHSMMTLTNNW